MRAAAFLLPSSLLVLSSLLGARAAWACSPQAPGVTGSFPAKDAKTHPANAPIVLQGVGDATSLTATVAGKPATLATLGKAPQSRLGLVIALTPQPVEGEAVTLSGNACGSGVSSPACEVDLSFVAGPNDAAAPAAPPTVSYDVHDYVDFRSSGGDCQSDSGVAVWVSFPAPAEVAEAEFWAVELRAANATEPLATSVQRRQATQAAFAFRLPTSAADEATAGKLCVSVRAFDVAGNESSRTETCAPCRVRVDPAAGAGGQGPFSPPAQPAWTPADVVPGGACNGASAAGAGGSGGSLGGGAGTSAAGGGGQLAGGSAGASSGLAPVTPSSDEGGCALVARSADDTRRGAVGALLLGALGLLGVRARRGRRSAP